MPDNHLLQDPAADRATLRRGGIEPLPDRTGRLALSFAQQRLWFLSRLAGVSEADDRVVAEAADLIYHMLVLLKSRGVPLASVVAELAARHAQQSNK